jgi:hypothetical protein
MNINGTNDGSPTTGQVNIAGQLYSYDATGLMTVDGKQYVISDDQDFVITTTGLPIGAVINGVLIKLSDLNILQRASVRQKYQV